jgi:hypothetical protein
MKSHGHAVFAPLATRNDPTMFFLLDVPQSKQITHRRPQNWDYHRQQNRDYCLHDDSGNWKRKTRIIRARVRASSHCFCLVSFATAFPAWYECVQAKPCERVVSIPDIGS